MRSRCASSSLVAGRKVTWDTLLTALLEELGNEPRPACLVARSQACAIVTVKILVEQNQVFPVRVVLKALDAPGDRPAAVFPSNENMNESPGNLRGHFPKVRFPGRAGRAFDFEIFAIIVVKLLQRFDQEIVQRKPDGAAPVRIAAKESAGGLCRFVIHAVELPIHVNFVGMIQMIPGKRADTVR